jgi:hypothetical protein
LEPVRLLVALLGPAHIVRLGRGVFLLFSWLLFFVRLTLSALFGCFVALTFCVLPSCSHCPLVMVVACVSFAAHIVRLGFSPGSHCPAWVVSQRVFSCPPGRDGRFLVFGFRFYSSSPFFRFCVSFPWLCCRSWLECCPHASGDDHGSIASLMAFWVSSSCTCLANLCRSCSE